MGNNRVFIPQEALDTWHTEGRVAIESDRMTLQPEGNQFRLKSAVRFMAEVGGGGDAGQLVGKVKDLDQVTQLGGEHCRDSVVLGDDAYEVVEGFVGEPIFSAPEESMVTGGSLADATRAAVGELREGPPSGELDMLARFFLQSR